MTSTEFEIIQATMLGYMAGIAGRALESPKDCAYQLAWADGWDQGNKHRLGLPVVVESANVPPESPPTMSLNRDLPKTHHQPVHPETGEIWHERAWELCAAATEARYESDDDLRAKAIERYDHLKAGLEFTEVPYFCQYTLLMGAAYKGANPPKSYGCHPDTWAQIPDDVKAKYQVFDEDKWRKENPVPWEKKAQ